MNKERRKQIEDLIDRLESLKDEIETVAGEERDYYDNMPENMQQGEKGEAASQAADNLDSARDDIDTCMDYLRSAIE